MARPRKSSAELQVAGAKPGRVAQRLAEETQSAVCAPVAPPVSVLTLVAFIAQVARERATFFERLVPGQTVCREHGAEFNWREDHPLTVFRKYATQVADGTIVAGALVRRACTRFLGDLITG